MSYKDLLSARPYPDSYSKQVLNNIQLISFSDEGAQPFGSFIYKVQKYPGDIDLVETYTECCSIDEVVKKFAKRFQKIVSEVVQQRKTYFTEAKIGEDNRFDISVGFLDKGNYIIDDKTRINVLETASIFYNNKWIKNDEFEMINNIMNNPHPTSDDYDVINNIFREHRILRWTAGEILSGYKMLPGKIKLSIQEALKIKGHIKIDIITDIFGKFIEMTNFLFLIEKNIDDKLYVINLGKPFSEDLIKKRVEQQLPKEIEKLFYSKFYYSPFKGAKRCWALARHYKDLTMIGKLKNIISSNISLLYQLSSELGNILLLLEKVESPPMATINNQIQDIKSRFTYVMELGKEEVIIDNLFNMATNEKNINNKINQIDIIKQYMKANVDRLTVEYLESNNITLRYPYIPQNPEYNTRSILPWTIDEKHVEIVNEIEEQSIRAGCDTCGKNK